IDLVLRQQGEELAIEHLRRRKIGAERLLDDEAAPRAVLLAGKTRSAEMIADRRESCWRRGEIEQPISAGVAFALDARELGIELFVGRRIVGIAVEVSGASEQPVGGCLLDLAKRKSAQALRQIAAEGVVGHLAARNADDREGLRKKMRGREIIERGQEQAMSEVSRCAEDDEAAGVRRPCRARGAWLAHERPCVYRKPYPH